MASLELEIAQARREIRPAFAASLLLLVIVGCVGALGVWSSWAVLDQVTRGQGRVIPSGDIKVVENLEGGIVAEILVAAGDRVEAGDVLLRLDRTQFAGEFNRLHKRYFALQARIARLIAEGALKVPVFAAETVDSAPEAILAERQLFDSRWQTLQADLAVLDSQRQQRRQALAEAELQVRSGTQSLALAEQEHKVVDGMVRRGLEPEMERIRTEKALTGARSDLDLARLAVERNRTAMAETELEIAALQQAFRARAEEELADTRREYEELLQQLPTLADRVERADVRAPVRGLVNRVLVNTVGGVADPGEALVELVPVDDALLVEAQIDPKEIAFVHPGQASRIKLTAYDFAVYGALDGTVEHISPDAIEDEQGRRLYQVRIRTAAAGLVSKGGEALPILPGMVAEVDILTGKRTVAAYFLDPLTNLKNNALRER